MDEVATIETIRRYAIGIECQYLSFISGSKTKQLANSPSQAQNYGIHFEQFKSQLNLHGAVNPMQWQTLLHNLLTTCDFSPLTSFHRQTIPCFK